MGERTSCQYGGRDRGIECDSVQAQEHSCMGWNWGTEESAGSEEKYTGQNGSNPLGERQQSSLSLGFPCVG